MEENAVNGDTVMHLWVVGSKKEGGGISGAE